MTSQSIIYVRIAAGATRFSGETEPMRFKVYPEELIGSCDPEGWQITWFIVSRIETGFSSHPSLETWESGKSTLEALVKVRKQTPSLGQKIGFLLTLTFCCPQVLTLWVMPTACLGQGTLLTSAYFQMLIPSGKSPGDKPWYNAYPSNLDTCVSVKAKY